MTSHMDASVRRAELDNDTQGWIMSCVSGIACILGAGIICVDVLATKLIGTKSFRIVESQVFLSSSLSLSAGVLIFTSLYSMLPTADEYLQKAQYSATAAAFIKVGLFVFGVVAIRVISTFIHSHLPSSVVECEPHHAHHHHHHHRPHKDLEPGVDDTGAPPPSAQPLVGNGNTEHSPLLQRTSPKRRPLAKAASRNSTVHPQPRPSLRKRVSQHLSAIMFQTKPSCDENGRCFGFSQPCRDDCVRCGKHQNPANLKRHSITDLADAQRSMAEPVANSVTSNGSRDGLLLPIDVTDAPRRETSTLDPVVEDGTESPSSATTATVLLSPSGDDSLSQHHHHVPRHEFMSLGLQTSLAIALHKLPEGFITYATNHANPTLGWSVFIALSIHNITEGFAMCLPLYLALDSRLKAMIWSSLLGGISQPAGAGIAVLWIWGVRKGTPPGDGSTGSADMSWAVYGGMFAATAGVMTNVALQLFSESLRRSRDHAMCIGFAVAGMAILGLSFALTAE
ncbi:hypothetical protein VTO42DRAFT_6251 [Malbranchea cinnamomea]